ncbi:MAG: hypothetical protein GY696_26265 [Gammaproteobacteria bacterium]|nr:hypothetical protein [Gammaproteobacteria bacterium]
MTLYNRETFLHNYVTFSIKVDKNHLYRFRSLNFGFFTAGSVIAHGAQQFLVDCNATKRSEHFVTISAKYWKPPSMNGEKSLFLSIVF